jgi:quercetin dioxygenase-like cupin family protein
MRRLSVLASFVVLVALVAFGVITTTAAQEATPAAPFAVVELAPGVTAEILATAPSARAEGQTVYVARFVFQPGAEIYPHSHPGTAILSVDSGAWGWTLLEGTAHVVRGAGSGGTAVEDVTEPGTEIVLNPGDAIYYEDDVIHTARGASDEPTVLYGTAILTEGQPLIMPVGMDMGTPAP